MTIVNALDEEITRWEKVQTEVFKLRPITNCVPIKEFAVSKRTVVFSLKAYFLWGATIDKIAITTSQICKLLKQYGYERIDITWDILGGYLLVQVRVTNRRFQPE